MKTFASWGYVIRHQRPVKWARVERSVSQGSPLRQSRAFRDALASPRSALLGVTQSRLTLWSERIAPLSSALDGVEHLVVIPSGAMLGVPVEALVDPEGGLVGERLAVSYIPSATIYAWLTERSREREKERREKTLLVGDPPFTQAHLEQMEKEREAEAPVLASTEPLPEATMLRDALAGNDAALASLPRLPGTQVEVKSIAKLSPERMLLLGLEASEQELVRLSESGELERFKILHIATHALVDDERPERSALVLSQVNLPDALEAAMAGRRIYDGLVTAEEILREWRLGADLVTLSACETGLGREVQGEGYVGFSHAFFQAGAPSLLVSLWKVEDRATSLLMTRFYENYFGSYKDKRNGKKKKPMPKAEALQEAKHWLRNYTDENGRKPFEHPFYWSAFILIGERG